MLIEGSSTSPEHVLQKRQFDQFEIRLIKNLTNLKFDQIKNQPIGPF